MRQRIECVPWYNTKYSSQLRYVFFLLDVVQRKKRFLLNLGFLSCYLFAGKSIHDVERREEKKKLDTLPRMDEIEGCFLCDWMHNGVSLVAFFFVLFFGVGRVVRSSARTREYIILANAFEGEFPIGHLSSSQVSSSTSPTLSSAFTAKQWQKKIIYLFNIELIVTHVKGINGVGACIEFNSSIRWRDVPHVNQSWHLFYCKSTHTLTTESAGIEELNARLTIDRFLSPLRNRSATIAMHQLLTYKHLLAMHRNRNQKSYREYESLCGTENVNV